MWYNDFMDDAIFSLENVKREKENWMMFDDCWKKTYICETKIHGGGKMFFFQMRKNVFRWQKYFFLNLMFICFIGGIHTVPLFYSAIIVGNRYVIENTDSQN